MSLVPEYRYFTADIITGTIVAEIPFQSVSWERKINAAGSFSGSIAANAANSESDHFDLYNNTLPGRYALYVMRDEVCVWGGIIWGRDYDIVEKNLTVNALEFISYFFHRTFWKTFSTDEYQASNNSTAGSDADTIKSFLESLITSISNDQSGIETDELAYGASDVHCRIASYARSAGGVATLVTRSEPCGFAVGDSVYIYGVPVAEFNGAHFIDSVSSDGFTFTYNDGITSGSAITTTTISETVNSYAVLYSTKTLLETNANIRLTYNISSELDNYVTNARGDSNPFTFRGSDARYIGDIFKDFADSGVPCKPITARADTDPEVTVRFDYYIESSYDALTQTFNNVFKAWLVKKDINNPSYVGSRALTELYGYSGLDATNFIFEHPGNIVSFSLNENADAAATRTWMVDSANDLGDVAEKYYGAYTNIPYLNDNFPILETLITDVDLAVSYDRQVAPYAKQYSYRLSPPVGSYSFTVNGSLHPKVGSYTPGDWCIITSDDAFISARMKPPFENRTGILVRKIRGFRVSVPDNPTFPETVDLDVVPEWEDL
jgi:hypothetical protein